MTPDEIRAQLAEAMKKAAGAAPPLSPNDYYAHLLDAALAVRSESGQPLILELLCQQVGYVDPSGSGYIWKRHWPAHVPIFVACDTDE